MKAIQLRYNIAKLLDYHSSGREVLVSYLCEPIPASLDAYIKAEGAKLGDFADYGTRAPSSDGEHQEWTIANVSPYAFLVETATEFQPSFALAQAEADRVWPLAVSWLTRPIPLSGHVYGAGRAVGATITIAQIGAGFTYRSEPTYGRYHIFLPDGAFTLVVSAPGFATRNVPVTINNAVPAILDIDL